ncbi:MAG: CAP domain-containing protein [Candidatus Tectimicrobiota bacterium]
MQRTFWRQPFMLCFSLAVWCTSCATPEAPPAPSPPLTQRVTESAVQTARLEPPPAPVVPPAPLLPPPPTLSPLARLEQELAAEINLARTQPRTYAAFLRSPERGSRPTGSGSRLASQPDLDEALHFLQTTTPLAPLALSRGMSAGARDLAHEQGRTGAVGHRGSDGSQVESRVNRYGRWQGQISENLSYGFDDARLMTLSLIIDEGLPERGHRLNLFDAQARVLGVACGPHPAVQVVCVMTFSDDYTEAAP